MARLVVGASNPELAAEAAERAIALVGGGHRLIVLYVTNPSLVAAPVSDPEAGTTARLTIDDEMGPEEVLASAERMEADGRSDLEDALRRRRLDARIRIRVDTGELGETLCRIASEERADLIVVGRRRSARNRRIRRVLDNAPCPVLVVNGTEPSSL